MSNVNEVIDRQIDPMGHINPSVCSVSRESDGAVH